MVHYYMPLLCLFASIGRVVWSREEALTRISALDFVGLPSAHYGTQGFPVLLDKEQPSSMLAMFVQRFLWSAVTDTSKCRVQQKVILLVLKLPNMFVKDGG